jgi:hypothetical protein
LDHDSARNRNRPVCPGEDPGRLVHCWQRCLAVELPKAPLSRRGARSGLKQSRAGPACGLVALERGRAQGGENEARHGIIGASHWIHSREHRRGRCRGLLPVRQLSCRLRRETRRRAAAASGRAGRGNPGRGCSGCRSAAWNTHEPWRSGQSCGQALTTLVLTSRDGRLSLARKRLTGSVAFQEAHVVDADGARFEMSLVDVEALC